MPDHRHPAPAPVPLLVVGAGGFGRETAAAVGALNDSAPCWELLGYLDDDPGLAGLEFEGARVLGPVDAGVSASPGAMVVVCTGRPDDYFSRPAIVGRLGLDPARFATVVHPAAAIARTCSIGRGTVVLAGAVATARCRVGDHVAVMPGVTLTHDDDVGDFVTLASGARLGGGVRLGRGAYIGAGALVREGVRVGEWSTVGMGAVVTRTVPDGEVWYGNPARLRRRVEVPVELHGRPGGP